MPRFALPLLNYFLWWYMFIIHVYCTCLLYMFIFPKKKKQQTFNFNYIASFIIRVQYWISTLLLTNQQFTIKEYHKNVQTYHIFRHRNENLNLLIWIKFLNLFYINIKIKTEKFTGPNKVLLVLSRRTGAHLDCEYVDYRSNYHRLVMGNVFLQSKTHISL